ncbi:MAG: insulinase family protein [Bacteroidales bacterium]|nr:insulinase family protein [Bacteroidales bacterium]MBR1491116.1 insulinase family protein [Bacteroidales bacterium]
MKRILIISALLPLLAAFPAAAQSQEEAMQQAMAALPNDPAVRIGHLDNGLTYYIRHNELPAQRAEFYLATNVGAIQEEPDQDGLAHFLEHMCFNGTEHFPEKGILDYLRSIGAEFGRNINASTGFEETQYMLNNIPVQRETVVDTCLMILCDYAHFVNNDPAEIDKERGVIIEERRQRRNAQWRTMERSLPYYFKGTKMENCTLIGRQESLETFKPESLVNFYRTWYHPDMQAVVVVGDVDVDRTEAKIKEIFSVIPKCENPKAKEHLKVPDNQEPIVGIITDPETTVPTVEMIWKSEAMPEQFNPTVIGQTQDLLKMLIGRIMAERFADIVSQPDSPYLEGIVDISSLIYEDIDAVMGEVALKEDNILPGFKAFYTEVERMKRFGFADDELERAKTDILTAFENAVNKAPTRRNPQFIGPILSNFFDKQPILEPETELQLGKQLLASINAQVLSMLAAQMITDENLIVLYSGPEKEGIATPTAEQLLQVIAEVKASEIKPLEGEEIASEFLDPALLKGSKVKKTAKAIYGATQWTLKNGVKVIVLPTDYTKDQILLNLNKDGGLSLVSNEDMPSMDQNIFALYQSNTGVAGFSGTQVSKMLTGKSVSVTPYIGQLETGIRGTSTQKDLETAFQLLYLYWMDPRFDPKEYDNGIQQLKAILPNLQNQPTYKLQTEMYKTLYGGHPRRQMISAETLEKANLETLEKVYRSLFSDIAGATMTIVGDVDLETLKPLVEKYIGSLPKGKKAAKWVDTHEDIVKGRVENIFAVDMQTPKSTVLQVWTADMPYTELDAAALDVVSYILDIRYTNSLREDEGGTYGASTAAQINRRPKEQALIQVGFDCRPSVCDKLRSLAIEGIRDLAENGPTDEEMDNAVKNLRKNIPENRVNNAYWRNSIEIHERYGEDRDAAREAAINALTKETVRQTLQRILAQDNLIELVMKPANTAEAE